MTTNYNDVRHNLISMLEELDKRLTTITQNVRHADEDVEQDFEEQATQNENNEVQDYLGNSARIEIAAIKQAIARIDRGDYDVCQTCGERINSERLKAVPYSLQCIKCASLVEKY
ncbi:MAG: TraR/DksA C4-type zinc finger protein [Methylococcales bacterium]|nr:TraR/DksA C4-type zinc finger protein [Methylococcales bacterium]MDD5755116.1 TraR/DksA C4-type zinc finger protein [Methylococcales bacterium]